MKVSTLSFIIALVLSLVVFGLVAYFTITGIMTDDPDTPVSETTDTPGEDESGDVEVIPPDEIEKIEGESFTVLVAGYGPGETSIDAMVVLEVNKEEQRVSIHPINADTKVYVGHADGLGNLNIRIGDLVKYEDVQYVADKIRATTGLKITNYITFTAEGFIEAFDKFNEHGDYTYVVPRDMEHVYVEESTEEGADEITQDLTKYNISFKKGDKLTSGIDIYNMLRYKGDSEADRMSRMSIFVRDILQKIIPAQFKEANLTKIITTAEALVKLTDSIKTDVTAKTFISETFGLITKVPEFSFEISSKYTKGITNFK
ncbi:MAG: LCP family protein [Clostridia bacterium]|nr:LCP family protein [Clostridia bacterium]